MAAANASDPTTDYHRPLDAEMKWLYTLLFDLGLQADLKARLSELSMDLEVVLYLTPFGHYQFRVLPFGLTNAPATFQSVMNNLFNPPKFNADGSLNSRCYLLSGKQFNLVTDNRPNTFLQTQPILSRRQARWREYLQRFHFNWVHRAADELTDHSLIDDIAEAYAADPFFADAAKTAEFIFAQSLWWKGDLIVVPDSKDTKRLILEAFHDHPMAGHFGCAKTLKAIKSRFYWRYADKEVSDYIRNCPSCQLQTTRPSKPAGLLQPLDVPPYAWHTVTTDYITGLTCTPKGNNAIAVFVDKLTKRLPSS
ncbi:hypothetical protein WJX82_000917 [Trebouxia sp. C0006]